MTLPKRFLILLPALLVGVGLLVWTQSGGEAAAANGSQPAPETPKPLRPVDRLLVQSRLEYRAEESKPQMLEVIYQSADEARWNRQVLDGRAITRDTLFRSAGKMYHLPPFEVESEEFSEGYRDHNWLTFELRRATFLWPRGHAWKANESKTEHTTTIRFGEGEQAHVFGTLIATLGADGTLVEIRSKHADGTPHERLHIKSWQTLQGLRWPRELSFHAAGRLVWDERVERVMTSGFGFDSSFFLPPDRRARIPAVGTGKLAVQPVDLMAITIQMTEIPEHSRDWESAEAFGREVFERTRDAEADKPTEWVVSENISFELDDDGRPIAVQLRLADPQIPAPAGWTTLHDRPGLATFVPTTTELDTQFLSDLRYRARQGRRSEDNVRPLTTIARRVKARVGTQIALYMEL